MSKRKPRNKIDKSSIDLLKPLNMTDFGTEADPCFGVLHDLKASECQRCGDAEICSIVFAQNQHIKRAKIEKKTPFKDLYESAINPEDLMKAKKLIKIKLKKYPGNINKVIRIVNKRTLIPTEEVEKLLKKINKFK